MALPHSILVVVPLFEEKQLMKNLIRKNTIGKEKLLVES